MRSGDASALTAAFAAAGWVKPLAGFEGYFREHEAGQRVVLVAEEDAGPCGYVTILWRSEGDDASLPEIRDFNVLPAFRRRGIGTALMDAAEARVAQESDAVGLGVGLYADYGAAQRMYARRGYIPDGKGIRYRGIQVTPGAMVRVDDDLVLAMTKRLR
jgi:GNAT superfamily N-acetyltransferase